MVIGNGLIAKSFLVSDLYFDDCVIFASGVSNSTELQELQYDREKKLLLKLIYEHPEKKLVYFSTCSIYSEKKSAYLTHKLGMEELIRSCCQDFLILRLPNIVGYSKNPFQLTNFLFKKILDGEEVPVFKGTSRNLIDVEDLPKIVKIIVSDSSYNILDIAFENRIDMMDLLAKFELILKKNVSVKIFVNSELNYAIPNGEFLALANANAFLGFNSDVYTILKKYYSGRTCL